jgi:hypothetical protein
MMLNAYYNLLKLTKLNQKDFQWKQHLSLGIPTPPKNKTLDQFKK